MARTDAQLDASEVIAVEELNEVPNSNDLIKDSS
jgi:hypothetical protein